MSENNEQNKNSEDLFSTEDLMENVEIQNSEIPHLNSEENSEMIIDENRDNEEITEKDDIENVHALDIEELQKKEKENDDDEEQEEIQDKENAQASKKASTNTQHRLTELPLAKIKHIIKLDPEVKLVNNEALFLITKSTELFIKALAKESFGFAAQNRKKTILKSHVDSALGMLPVEL